MRAPSDSNESHEPKDRVNHSHGSVRIATISGIPIRLHFTFFLFLLWVGVVAQDQGGILWPLFLVAIFLCVILHELGHALTGQMFGVQTRDITLYPIGGVAMLEGRPNAKQELWIALAGPVVNVVIALGLLGIVLLKHGHIPQTAGELSKDSFLSLLMAANLSLALFNLIPAFPMDGGRVLRALLAMRMPEIKATRIAAGIGQILAIVLCGFGLVNGQVILVLIAFFVFLGAGQEVTSIRTRSFLAGRLVADAMQSSFTTLRGGDTLDEAAKRLLEGSQTEFPVVNGEEVLGVVGRSSIALGLSSEGPDSYVAGIMNREFTQVPPDAPLEAVAELMQSGGWQPVLVMNGEHLMGMLTRENLSEFIMLENARQSGRRRG
jgi:Zn-dependent protease/CBS domain-containing protein